MLKAIMKRPGIHNVLIIIGKASIEMSTQWLVSKEKVRCHVNMNVKTRRITKTIGKQLNYLSEKSKSYKKIPFIENKILITNDKNISSKFNRSLCKRAAGLKFPNIKGLISCLTL